MAQPDVSVTALPSECFAGVLTPATQRRSAG
jgi:hypothetical protein